MYEVTLLQCVPTSNPRAPVHLVHLIHTCTSSSTQWNLQMTDTLGQDVYGNMYNYSQLSTGMYTCIIKMVTLAV